MQLAKLDIRLAHSWEEWDGYKGEITFTNTDGEIKIAVGHELSQRILKICSEELLATTKNIAKAMATDIVLTYEQMADKPKALEN